MVLAESSNLRLTDQAGLVGARSARFARFARFARVCRVCAVVPFGLSRFPSLVLSTRPVSVPSCTVRYASSHLESSQTSPHPVAHSIDSARPDPSRFFQASLFVQILPNLLITFVTFLKLPFPSCTTCRVYRARWIREAFVCRLGLFGISGLQLRTLHSTVRQLPPPIASPNVNCTPRKMGETEQQGSASTPRRNCQHPRKHTRRQRQSSLAKSTLVLSLLAAAAPVTMAESCISLAGSTACPAFNSSSISTGPTLTGLLYV